MPSTSTTTIRVSVRTRDRLRDLASRRGEPAGDVVASLVAAADEEALLTDAAAGFERIAGDRALLAAYREQSEGIEDVFDAPAPEW